MDIAQFVSSTVKVSFISVDLLCPKPGGIRRHTGMACLDVVGVKIFSHLLRSLLLPLRGGNVVPSFYLAVL